MRIVAAPRRSLIPKPSDNNSTRSRRMNAQAGGQRKPASWMPWAAEIGSPSCEETPVSVYALSMRSRGWASPPPPQHFNSLCHDTYGGGEPGPAHDPSEESPLTSPSASVCGFSTMICPRCEGLVAPGTCSILGKGLPGG